MHPGSYPSPHQLILMVVPGLSKIPCFEQFFKEGLSVHGLLG